MKINVVSPERVWAASEVLGQPCPVPAAAGVYGWYFDDPPEGVPVGGCVTAEGKVLLYVGIAPKAPPRNGRPPSQQNLRKRLRYHYRGNAAGSTLRLTLGSLLRRDLGIELRRVGSGQRLAFTHDGEQRLSAWMRDHAFVCWEEHPEPWRLETQLLRSLSLPLNLDQNRHHPFSSHLSAARAEARGRARELPVADG